jgi:hypothetical protein
MRRRAQSETVSIMEHPPSSVLHCSSLISACTSLLLRLRTPRWLGGRRGEEGRGGERPTSLRELRRRCHCHCMHGEVCWSAGWLYQAVSGAVLAAGWAGSPERNPEFSGIQCAATAFVHLAEDLTHRPGRACTRERDVMCVRVWPVPLEDVRVRCLTVVHSCGTQDRPHATASFLCIPSHTRSACEEDRYPVFPVDNPSILAVYP